jgi:hypothetical protein
MHNNLNNNNLNNKTISDIEQIHTLEIQRTHVQCRLPHRHINLHNINKNNNSNNSNNTHAIALLHGTPMTIDIHDILHKIHTCIPIDSIITIIIITRVIVTALILHHHHHHQEKDYYMKIPVDRTVAMVEQ